MLRFLAIVAAVLAGCSVAVGQQGCPAPTAPHLDPASLLFNGEQEMYLGEAMSEHLQSRFLVIDDDAVTGYLRRVGDRVAKHLPPADLHYQFFLYDQPEIQSFEMPGGRVYVSRKMVAFLHNEDELAGLLGHELGHAAARQSTVEASRRFRQLLGVQQVGDRADIFEKYNEYVESTRTKRVKGSGGPDSGKEQMIADRIGVEAAARAGYAPQAFAAFMDRLLETKGNTGTWLSELFGATKPDEKRLREMLKDVSSLPAPCIEVRVAARTDEFQAWQAAVLRYNGIGHGERLHDVVTRKKLNGPLRGDIENFRFSPDGKYLLAQDDSGIDVLTREPLAFKFRIEAPSAEPAQFSPDSQRIDFVRRDLQIEAWDVARQERGDITDMGIRHGCRQTELSPDAKYLACFGNELDLSIYEVASGESIFHRERFFDTSSFSPMTNFVRFLFLLINQRVAVMQFSPDARYFAASVPTGEELAFDLSSRKKLGISGPLRTALANAFTFIGTDRVVGLDRYKAEQSPVVKFPSGEIIDRIPLGYGVFTATANPKCILIRPVPEHPVGVYNLETKKIVSVNRMAAMDVWSDSVVAERLNGEIGLYKIGETTPTTVTQLPLGPLGFLRARSVSGDLQWLAASNRTRGAIWNLDANQRVYYTRGFQRAWHKGDAQFYLDFPEFEKAQREIMAYDGTSGQQASRPLREEDDETLMGAVIIEKKHDEKERDPKRNFQMNVLDTDTGKVLWSRSFPKRGPTIDGLRSAGRIVLVWPANSDGVKDEIEREPKLKEKLATVVGTENDYLLEVVESQTGTTLGGVIIRTGKGSFHLQSADSAGDWIVASDNENRVLLFSLSTGEEKARWFGGRPILSRNGDRVCLSNERGQLRVYNMSSPDRPDELLFANKISLYAFSADAARLLVLTDDQTAFTINLNKASAASSQY